MEPASRTLHQDPRELTAGVVIEGTATGTRLGGIERDNSAYDARSVRHVMPGIVRRAQHHQTLPSVAQEVDMLQPFPIGRKRKRTR